MTPIAILGGGGHAKVIISTLRAAGSLVGAVYDDGLEVGKTVLGVEVKGPIAQAATDPVHKAVIAIGSNRVRARIARDPLFEHIEWHCAVHPMAFVDESVQIGAGSVVFAGSVLQPDSKLGCHTIVNTCASVDHDGQLDNFAQLCPGVHLAGNVHVGLEAFLGTGASVIPGVHIGERTVVGAGSCVIKDLPPDVLAVGVPALVRPWSSRAKR